MAVRKKITFPDGRIGVLMGGASSERTISLKSGHAVYTSLAESGFAVTPIDITTENINENLKMLKEKKIQCAFVALHGRFGEDGGIQQILEKLRIPYTGSGVLASRLAMDKIISRHIFQLYGIPVPRYKVLQKTALVSSWLKGLPFRLPVVIKPATHGSSIGLSLVRRPEEFKLALDYAFQFDERVLVEEYLEGREITVSILDDTSLPIIEIIPKKQFFDYEAKYHVGMTEYVVPAPLEKSVRGDIQRIALAAHTLLGCSGCSRIDMIYSSKRIPYVLEVNTIPGLTQTSLLPKAAKTVGISFIQLVLTLIKLAYEKEKV